MACESEKSAASAAIAAVASACTSFGANMAALAGGPGDPMARELWPPCFSATQGVRPALEALANCAASNAAGGGSTGDQINTFLQQLESEIQQIIGMIPTG